MCDLCALTCTFDPARHSPGQSLSEAMRVIEGSDAAANRFTAYSIDPGDTFAGTLSYAGDRDWVAVTLEENTSYDIGINAYHGGGGSLHDSYLRIYDADGEFLISNDDGGPNYDSALEFTATTSGTYFISVGSYADSYTGTYTVEIDTGTPTIPSYVGTLDDLANYLTDGYWNDTDRSGRSFDTASDNRITVDITDLTAEGQKLARWAFEAWEMVADIEFAEVRFGADISFDDDDSGAYAYSSDTFGEHLYGGNIASSHVNVSTGWLDYYGADISSYSFATYIHEIGHALGLGHQGGYNGSATFGVDETFLNDSWQLSVMSYFSQSENTTTAASEAAIVSTMMVDIVAIQNLYGAADSNSASGGDTIWGQGTNLGGYWGDLLETEAREAVSFTIYDVDGTDLINLSNYSTDNRLDLNDQSFSDVGGLIGNIAIARDTFIEDANLGRGNDTVMGNELSNDIYGGGGSDSLDGAAGADRLRGGYYADTLNGGEGSDSLWGEAGFDVLNGGGGEDRLFGGQADDWLRGGDGADRMHGGTGNDTAQGGNGRDTLYGGTGEDLLFGGAHQDQLFGQKGDDVLRGGMGADLLVGGDGRDTLSGGAGRDTLKGGSGDDLLTGGSDADVFRFNAKLSQGQDTISDFTRGSDRIEIYHVDFADLTFATLVEGLQVSWSTSAVVLENITDLSLDDFIFS